MDNEEVTRDAIKELCRDDIIFHHMDVTDPSCSRLLSVNEVLLEFKRKGFLDDNEGWTKKIGCPDLQKDHKLRANKKRSQHRMAGFLNRLVQETTNLTGLSLIRRRWSSEHCREPLPGSAEEHKADIILLPENDKRPDWRRVVSVVEMKEHGVDVHKPALFDGCAKQANAVWGCQDARNFVIILRFIGEEFTFAFFDRRGAVCPAVLNIMKDVEEFLRLILYLSLADPGMVGIEPSIVHNDAGRFIRSRLFGMVPIRMVLFINNKLHGRGTVARHVTVSKESIIQAFTRTPGAVWSDVEKWFKGMEDEVAIVVKDTWIDFSAAPSEGMILNFLRLKGVIGVTRLLFEGLVAGPAVPHRLAPSIESRNQIGSVVDIRAFIDQGGNALAAQRSGGLVGAGETVNIWSSTLYNRMLWGFPTLASAPQTVVSNIKAHDPRHLSPDEDVPPTIHQERLLTRSWLYPLCVPIYEFSCIYEALVGIRDCINSHGQAYSPYRISDNGEETEELFPISFIQSDTSMWNMGLVEPAQSDWGCLNEPGLHKIRRGLLYDHAFSSWAIRDTHSKSKRPFKDVPACGTHSLSLAFPSQPSAPSGKVTNKRGLHEHTQATGASTGQASSSDGGAITSSAGAAGHSTLSSQSPPTSAASQAMSSTAHASSATGVRKRPLDTIGSEAGPGPKRRLVRVPKAKIDSQRTKIPQVYVACFGARTAEQDLEHFAHGGGMYELKGTRAWMAIQTMLAHEPHAPRVARNVAHDLEGYYYVILTLAFMFDEPYTLKRVSTGTTKSVAAEGWIRRWVENTLDRDIWIEAKEKRLYFAHEQGFETVAHLLGRHWAVDPVKTMLKEMRELLFVDGNPTHSGMIDIIERALFGISTDPLLSDLCEPREMTEEWKQATGSGGAAEDSNCLPALRTNMLYRKGRQDSDVKLNLFARMPCPPQEGEKHLNASTSVATTLNSRMARRIRVQTVKDRSVSQELENLEG